MYLFVGKNKSCRIGRIFESKHQLYNDYIGEILVGYTAGDFTTIEVKIICRNVALEYKDSFTISTIELIHNSEIEDFQLFRSEFDTSIIIENLMKNMGYETS